MRCIQSSLARFTLMLSPRMACTSRHLFSFPVTKVTSASGAIKLPGDGDRGQGAKLSHATPRRKRSHIRDCAWRSLIKDGQLALGWRSGSVFSVQPLYASQDAHLPPESLAPATYYGHSARGGGRMPTKVPLPPPSPPSHMMHHAVSAPHQSHCSCIRLQASQSRVLYY